MIEDQEVLQRFSPTKFYLSLRRMHANKLRDIGINFVIELMKLNMGFYGNFKKKYE